MLSHVQKVFISIVFMLIGHQAIADQYVWINPSIAEEAVDVLREQRVIVTFCKPCGDFHPEFLLTTEADNVRINNEFNKIVVEGKSLDLAYAYIVSNDRLVNLAIHLGLDPGGVDTVLKLLPPSSISPSGFENRSSTPEELMLTLIEAAQTRNPFILGDLCDPNGGDIDTRSICELAETYEHSSKWEIFLALFAPAEINGTIDIECLEDDCAASVPFTFPTRQEKMNMVKRHGVWYLNSF